MSDVKKAWGRTLKEFHTIEEDFAIKRLYPAEHGLMEACALGEAYFCEGFNDQKSERPVELDPKTNLIRVNFLRFLILGGDEQTPMDGKGMMLFGAWIECSEGAYGKALDIEGHIINHDIAIMNCHLDGQFVARGAALQTLSLGGSSVGGIRGDGLKTSGDIFLRAGFEAKGEVRLVGAEIGGGLDCTGGHFLGEGKSLSCDGLKTSGDIFLRDDFEAKGEVRLVGAEIGGNLECMGGHFLGEGDSLSCGALKTSGGIFLCDGFEAKGAVRLLGAEIGGDLACRDGRFLSEDSSINCEGMKVVGHGLFHSHKATMQINGCLDLRDAEFGRSLTFQNARFTSAKENIDASGLKVGSELRFEGAKFAGAVSLTNARIGGDVTTEGASFEQGFAIERTKVEGILVWRGLVHFVGHLSFDQSRFEALSFGPKSWQMPTSIDLDGLTYERFQDLPDGCDGHYWVNAFLGKCGKSKKREDSDSQNSFEPHAHGQLAKVLNDMGHEEEARAVNIDRRERNLRAERQRLKSKGGEGLAWLAYIWRWFVGFATDHGYRPGKAFLFMLALGALGSAFSQLAANRGLMAPTDPLIYKTQFHGEDRGEVYAICQKNWTKIMCAPILPAEHSEFLAPAYSFDVLLPIINFRQQEDWAPRVVDEKGNRLWSGWWMRNWEWAQTGLGWLLSLLLVSGVTGIIRRE